MRQPFVTQHNISILRRALGGKKTPDQRIIYIPDRVAFSYMPATGAIISVGAQNANPELARGSLYFKPCNEGWRLSGVILDSSYDNGRARCVLAQTRDLFNEATQGLENRVNGNQLPPYHHAYPHTHLASRGTHATPRHYARGPKCSKKT